MIANPTLAMFFSVPRISLVGGGGVKFNSISSDTGVEIYSIR